MRWEKTAERNEALDCFVYARAAVAIRRPNFRKLARELNTWLAKRAAEFLRAGQPVPTPADEVISAADPKQPPIESETAAPKPATPEKPARAKRPRESAAAQLRSALRGY